MEQRRTERVSVIMIVKGNRSRSVVDTPGDKESENEIDQGILS